MTDKLMPSELSGDPSHLITTRTDESEVQGVDCGRSDVRRRDARLDPNAKIIFVSEFNDF